MSRNEGECARCGRPRTLPARRLCGACNMWCRRHGTLGDYPRSKPPEVDREKVRAEYADLREEALTKAQIAARLGVSRTTLYEAVGRRTNPLPDGEVARLRRMVGAS